MRWTVSFWRPIWAGSTAFVVGTPAASGAPYQWISHVGNSFLQRIKMVAPLGSAAAGAAPSAGSRDRIAASTCPPFAATNGDDTMRTQTLLPATALLAVGAMLGWPAASGRLSQTLAQDKKPAEVSGGP